MASFEATLAQGSLWTFMTVFAAGVATSLTPCVYPMIPITVSIFGGRRATSRGTAFLLATCYVMGIALTYAALGVMAALGGWAAGGLLASPWLIVPLSTLFVILAASMFGLWELHLPHWLSSRIALVGGRGYHGAFLMGTVGGVIIAPCTGPVLAGLLAYVATTRNIAVGAGLLFTYAIGIGVLFWLIATFAVSLPKAGHWMRVVSSAFGVALLVAALFYLQNISLRLASYASGSWRFAAANTGLLVVGLALGALHLDFRGAGIRRAAQKGLGILLATVGSFGLINFALSPEQDLPWVHDEAVAVARAQQLNKPLVVDFSAQWCQPCKLMEATVLSHPAVRRELERFVLLKIDVTKDTARDRALQDKYSARELPLIVIFGRDGREQARVGEVLDPGKLLPVLRRIQ